MLTITPGEIPTAKLHAYMLSAIAPRPICFASTVDKNGQVNLSPYSFFNAFGSNPTTLIFSPARRVRDNTIKHTLENVLETMEVCINVVNYDMVWQMSLASTEYGKGVNEFEKAGFTELPSEIIKAPRVKESPVQFECKVRQVIETGNEGGAGNLIICEILKMHINESVLDADGKIDQNKIQLVARLGGDWYAKAFGDALFEIEKPVRTHGIGVDQIPEAIRYSTVLTGNNLGQLGNVESLPSEEELAQFAEESEAYHNLKTRFSHHAESMEYERHLLAQEYLQAGDVVSAWKILLVK
ncbi:MAG: flavin reductase family protein [Bacteroidota bacterium]|nr:flavin reductase family protein [Bacteroidota bacterium]MDX5431191.1 flavin reductase family protein [Bacteroidota bacterium]MDX5469930.1 flavin reductase family protein [Bacteroidota bacterium]